MIKISDKIKGISLIILFIIFVTPVFGQSVNELVNEGISYGKLGEYNKAIETFDKAIAINPDEKVAWYNKGIAYDKLGEYEKSIEAYNGAITIDPDFADAWNNKGIALGRLGKNDEAIQAFDRVLDINPDDEYALQSKYYTQFKKWIKIVGIALFVLIALIVIRNIKSKSKNPPL